MDGVQLPQGYSHFEEAVYFLPFSPQKFLVLILSTSEGWKAESTLEPPSGFEHGTPGLGIQGLSHYVNIWEWWQKNHENYQNKQVDLPQEYGDGTSWASSDEYLSTEK